MFKNVFGSGFLVRTAHVILTWVITLILFLHDTDLRRQEEAGQLVMPVLFVMLVLLSVLLYFAVSLMDPGFVLANDDGEAKLTLGASEEQQDMLCQSTKALRQRRCGHCLLQQPMRAKHCQTCKHCVQLLALFWGLFIAWSGFRPAPTWDLWLRGNGLLLGAASIVGVVSVVVVLLLGSHLYLISHNATTWEFMSRPRISYLRHCGADQNPFDRGAPANLWSFFCVWGTVAWEQMYFREPNDHA
ncbi:hypothetical protein COCON_G00167140 [Conger conger]|uniref:protein S-acyltransferase n=1 Tax=Conger conger TaxID=82655 RepID=A0A9Q1HTX4_CONCO|nr:hypothetical protein COCON_G00167140 [Conger conger]